MCILFINLLFKTFWLFFRVYKIIDHCPQRTSVKIENLYLCWGRFLLCDNKKSIHLQKQLNSSHKINFCYFKADVLTHTRNFFSVLNIIRSLVDCNTTLQWLALHLSAFWRKKFSTITGLVVSVMMEKPTSCKTIATTTKTTIWHGLNLSHLLSSFIRSTCVFLRQAYYVPVIKVWGSLGC